MFSDKDTNKQKSFLARILAAVAMISLAYIVIVMTPEGYRQTLQAEINAFKRVVGPEDSALVLQNSADMFNAAFVETGVISTLEGSIELTGVSGEEFWRTPMVRIVENLKLMFYQTVFRMAVFFHWLILGAPFIFALASDGYYKRKTKQYEFGIASANLFRIWVKAGIFAFFIIDVYFIFPAAGVFGVLLPPIMFVILGLSLRYALSNVSKVF